LSSGKLQYDKPEDAYLVYKNGKLSTLITDAGKKGLEALMDDVVGVKNACSEKGLAGCMDPESINYNKDAVISDGNCEYCPCDFVKNPNYDKNKPAASCQTNNLKCIPVKKPGDNTVKKPGDNAVKKSWIIWFRGIWFRGSEIQSVNEADKKNECTDCDIIEKISSNPNANITINLGSNSNSLRNVFSPSKKKTTISLTETESDENKKVISEIPEKKSKKQK
jgi:hypothetical protein